MSIPIESVPVTALYAGILAIFACVLSAISGSLRAKTGVALGGGDDPSQLLAVRRHGNFLEWVTPLLVLLLVLELNGVSATVLHSMGISLIAVRLFHAFGLRSDTIRGAGRFIGAAGSLLLTLVAAVWCITTFF